MLANPGSLNLLKIKENPLKTLQNRNFFRLRRSKTDVTADRYSRYACLRGELATLTVTIIPVGADPESPSLVGRETGASNPLGLVFTASAEKAVQEGRGGHRKEHVPRLQRSLART